ncbi:hypothetical protein [Oenococcus sp.]|uniref:phage head-tail connector protein n=1 Tax=Oenococcus sp. TaxID=1979414 RepID=UPI0039E7753D
MSDDAFFDQVKSNLRIKTNDDGINGEISDLIASARYDLYKIGTVDKNLAYSIVDPLVKQAVIAYCKAKFGLNNDDSDKYWAAYVSLRNDLSGMSQWKSDKTSDTTIPNTGEIA